MGINKNHALGRNQKFFVATEGTAGTFAKPVATDAVKVLSSSFDVQIERKNRMDARATRSVLERITGKSAVNWTMSKYLIPSGTAGTPPDDHLLFYAVMGGYTNSSSTSDTYSLSASQVLRTVSLTRHFNSVFQEAIWGAWVNSMTINVAGGDEPKVTFEGGAMGHAHTGTSTLNGAMVGSTTMVVQTADSYNFETNSVVAIDTSDNSGAGYKISADGSRPSFTIEASVSEANGDPVVPFVPSETTAGSPINGVSGSLTIDGGTVPITAFDITISNGIKALADEAMQTYPTDAIPGHREVTGNISFRARKDFILELGKRKAFTARDIAVILGSVAGKKCTINLDYLEMAFAAVEVPEADEAIIKLPYVALGSSGEDECNIVFT